MRQPGRHALERVRDSVSDGTVCSGTSARIRLAGQSSHWHACLSHRGALHHANFALEILTSERMLERAKAKEAAKQRKLDKKRLESLGESSSESDDEDGSGGGKSSGHGKGRSSRKTLIASEEDAASEGGETIGTSVSPAPLQVAMPCRALKVLVCVAVCGTYFSAMLIPTRRRPACWPSPITIRASNWSISSSAKRPSSRTRLLTRYVHARGCCDV